MVHWAGIDLLIYRKLCVDMRVKLDWIWYSVFLEMAVDTCAVLPDVVHH